VSNGFNQGARSAGDFILISGEGINRAAVRQSLARAAAWPETDPDTSGEICRFAEPGPSLLVAWRGNFAESTTGHQGGLGLYSLARPPGGPDTDAARAHARQLELWRDAHAWAPRDLAGGYCYALWDARAGKAVVVSDAFRTTSVYYAHRSGLTVVATDLRIITGAGLMPRRVNAQALYHYLNFAYVPTPFTIYQDIHKLPPANAIEINRGSPRVREYWRPTYPEDLSSRPEELAPLLREQICDAVKRYRPAADRRWGNFLSGGTDSSSIAGILAREGKGAIDTFSIGFAEPGYDELGFSRVATEHFGLQPHMKVVSAADTLAAIPKLVQGFDEPCGNASAVPTYYCARLARESGVEIMIAGDGGDEIFGGNERYRKDKILSGYYHLPRWIRGGLEAGVRMLGSNDTRFVNRVRNFIRRGSLPNPERFYTDDAFASDHFQELLAPDFRAALKPEVSLDVIRQVYNRAHSASELHRLMYVDLQMAIGDNDIVKVTRAAKLAQVNVSFPYLDPTLVDFTGRLPAACKVKGLSKRYLFKKAMADILPEQIIKKKKQGFGLPISVWLREREEFSRLVHDVVLSSRAIQRGYFRPEFIRQLVAHHLAGTWDYSAEIWSLLMLELWHREYIDG
jgi:asparagine synthase (glutamine-hydrolysing)